MTTTLNQEKYQELLFNYQPKIIRTEAENERFLKTIEDLMSKNYRTPEEDKLYELLITLVEKFEQEYYQLNLQTKPQSMLFFLLEQRDLKPSDLIAIIGSEQMVNDLSNGDGVMTKEQALILADFFNVDYTVFCE